MATWRTKNDLASDSDDEDDSDFGQINAGREALVFVVDSGLCETPERLEEAIKIIRGALLSGLMVNDKDLIGIVFANTEFSPEPKEPDCLKNILVPQNCAVFLPLRQLTKDIVDYYLRFSPTVRSDFKNRFGIAPDGEGNFANMIRLCGNLFQQSGFKLSSSCIAYFTDRAAPHQTGSLNFQKAIQKARDLEEQNIEFHLIPMSDDFDYEPFYKEFLTLVRGVELDSFEKPDAQQTREILSDRKLKQDFVKRCLGRVNWTLGPDLDISIQYYSYFQKSVYPKKVKLLRRDNSVVDVKNVTVICKRDPNTNEITDERLMKPGDGWYEFQVGCDPIRVSTETLNRLRNIHTPGMLLLGFKHKSSLPQNAFLKACSFIYPDDNSIVGSKRLFRALWERCLQREKIAICLFVPRRKTKPRYVALIPVTGEYESSQNSERYVLTGDGFKVIYLPMIKNYRHINFSDWGQEESTPEGVEIFVKIIKKLRVKYNPSLFRDPALCLLEANLLALAFDIPTEGGGKTEMPNFENQDERISQYADNVREIFGSDVIPATKRGPSADGNDEAGQSSAKVAKITDDQVRSSAFISQLVANNALSSLTTKQLRIILEEAGVNAPKSMVKALLIDKVIESLQ